MFCLFFCEVAVGVGGNDERDQSAPTQTAPQQVSFGSDRDCGVDKVSRAPHDDGLEWNHTPGTSIYTLVLLYVPGTWYLVPGTYYQVYDISSYATYHVPVCFMVSSIYIRLAYDIYLDTYVR